MRRGGAPVSSGGSSFVGDGTYITNGQSGIDLGGGVGFGGLGSFGQSQPQLTNTSVSGGFGGGPGGGTGSYFIDQFNPIPGQAGLANTGAGGGGGSRNVPNGGTAINPGRGGSGWILIKPLSV